MDHPWVQLPVCFSVPSVVYGEEVGCAIVLNGNAPPGVKDNEVIKKLRKWMKEKKFAPVKWPTKWWIGPDEELPKTKTKKYIRVGLADVLGFGGELSDAPIKETKAKIDWGGKHILYQFKAVTATISLRCSFSLFQLFLTPCEYSVITGFRFFLACYVMFMHLGSNESWVSN